MRSEAFHLLYLVKPLSEVVKDEPAIFIVVSEDSPSSLVGPCIEFMRRRGAWIAFQQFQIKAFEHLVRVEVTYQVINAFVKSHQAIFW